MKQGKLKKVVRLGLIALAALPFDAFAVFYTFPYSTSGANYGGQTVNVGDQLNIGPGNYSGPLNANGGTIYLLSANASFSGGTNFSTGGLASTLRVWQGTPGIVGTVYSLMIGDPFIIIEPGVTLQQENSEYNLRSTRTMDIQGTLWCQWHVHRNGPTNLYNGGAINSDQPQDGFSNEGGQTLTMSGGTIYGNGPINNQGTWNMSAGSISAAGGFNNSGTLTMNGGSITSTFNNSGTFNANGGSFSNVNNTGSIFFTFVTNFGGSFTNNGTIYTDNSGTIGFTTNNNGTWNHRVGTLTINNFAIVGTFNVSANANIAGNLGPGTMNISSTGTVTFTANSVASPAINNSGTLTINPNLTVQTGNITNNNIFNIGAGSNFAGSGALTNNGTTNLSGTYSSTGIVSMPLGAKLSIASGGIFSNATTTTTNNFGTIEVLGTGRITSAIAGGSVPGDGAILKFNGATAFNTEATVDMYVVQMVNGSNVTLRHTFGSRYFYMDPGTTLNFTTGATSNGFEMYNGGTVNFSGTSTNNGYISGGTGGQINLNAGSVINGTGTLSNAIINTAGAVTNFNTIYNYKILTIPLGSTLTQSTRTLTNFESGTINLAGTLTGDGPLVTRSTSIINMSGSYTKTGNDTHAGIWNINSGGLFNKTVGTFTNTGTFNISGTGNITSPTFSGSTNSTLNIGNSAISNFSMTGDFVGVENINLVTNGSSLSTNARTISGVKVFGIGVGTTFNLAGTISGPASGNTGVINNYSALNVLTGAPVANFTNIQTINAFSNSTMNVNTTLTLTNTSILGQSTNQSSALNIAATKTLTTNAAINGVRLVTINPTAILSLAPGATLLNFWSLVINGTLQVQNGASFSINPGERISGSGNIDNSGSFNINGADVTLGGSLLNQDAGVIQITGTPTINFNGAFTNNGLIVATFNQSNSLPRINIGTTPTLANGTLAIGYQNNYITSGKYTFIHADTPLTTANIGGYILPQPSTFIRSWGLIAEDGDIKITVDRIGFGAVATDPEAKVIGNYMEQLGASNPSQSVLDLLNALEQITDPLELNAALISVSPPNYVALQSVAMLDDIFTTIQGRLGGVRLGYASGDAEVDKGVWVRVFGSSGKQKPDGNLSGYRDRISGVVFGIDNQVSGKLLLGAAGSYGLGNVTDLISVSSQTRIKNYQAMLYGTYKTDSEAYLDTIFSVGTNNYQATRRVNLITYSTVAESRYSGQQLSLKIQGSKNYIWKKYYQLTPMATAQYSFVRQLPYTESGAGEFNRIVEPNNINLLQLGIGGQFSVPFDEGNLTSIPSMHAMLLVDAKGGQLQTNTQFVSGGPILTSNVQSGKLIAVVGGALTFKVTDKLECIANYDFLARQKYYSNNFYLNFRYTF